MFTLAHTSDWHATSLEGAPLRELATKRVLGWISWKRKRRERHRPEVLHALFDDLRQQAPDAVAVTGDLTNVALRQEFIEAAGELERLGTPRDVFVVPGNHDAYAAIDHEVTWARWAPYLQSDPERAGYTQGRAPRHADYPTLRVRDGVALVGLCSAQPTPWFMATGRLGPEQLARTEALLEQLAEQGLCRVVMLHHPATDDGLSPRRRLSDGKALRAMLGRVGAELVLHGHRHRQWISEVVGPAGPIPVLCTRSASDVGVKESRRAQYHVMQIERAAAGEGYRIALAIRGYDRESGAFRLEEEREL